MKLIRRRKKKQTPFERATGFVKLGVKGLAAQRLLRRGLRGYRFTKRAVPLAALGAIGLLISKKLRGGGDETPPYSAPATPGSTAGTSAPAAATAATDTPSVDGDAAAPGVGDEQPPDDASHTDDTLDVEAPNQSTPPPPEETQSTK